jgi:alkanesulfonate monooxygenase SsuD/methylene tetrahydromethanopterin reductase-like flavin-dependent oxidoreductase (luciferase family)
MRVYHFSEQPYPDAWDASASSLRVDLPNSLCEPARAADLFHRYYDEWLLADELGLDIMVNEHHSTATCLSASVNLTLGILARITKRARLLALGVPLANRPDPLRIAEELAMIDVISRGRLDMGFVKGVPYEVAAATSNPVRMMDRLWEAHDFILKAMTTHDKRFSWEGEYFHYRNVNIWPRPYQDPHPPVWITAMSPRSAGPVAERGHVIATFLTGLGCKVMFDNYRKTFVETYGRQPSVDRFAYLALCAVGNSTGEALKRAHEIAGYLRTTAVVSEQFSNPPGYISPQDHAKKMKRPGGGHYMVTNRAGKSVEATNAGSEDLIDAGLLFAGTPDEVYEQIVSFTDAVGGIGNLLLMMQGGALSHTDTSNSLKLFAKDVLPRLKERAAVESVPPRERHAVSS